MDDLAFSPSRLLAYSAALLLLSETASTEPAFLTPPAWDVSEDADQDAIRDLEEILLGMDPFDPDDGLADEDDDLLTTAEEIFCGTDPQVADTDGDTWFDSEELLIYGTDPLDPLSFPQGVDNYAGENGQEITGDTTPSATFTPQPTAALVETPPTPSLSNGEFDDFVVNYFKHHAGPDYQGKEFDWGSGGGDVNGWTAYVGSKIEVWKSGEDRFIELDGWAGHYGVKQPIANVAPGSYVLAWQQSGRDNPQAGDNAYKVQVYYVKNGTEVIIAKTGDITNIDKTKWTPNALGFSITAEQIADAGTSPIYVAFIPNKLSLNTYGTLIDKVELLFIELKQRIPIIADDGGETTYEYATVSAVPWDHPTPGVEITEKEISGDQLMITAEIYDVLTDTAGDGADFTPKLWINSRIEIPVAGDVNGVYRLKGYSYQLFPGRNEVTVTVENAFGVTAHHMVVVEGDQLQGYVIVEEPPKVPKQPTYPVVYEIKGTSFTEDDTTLIFDFGGKSVVMERESIRGEIDKLNFRTQPFLSVNEPEMAKPEKLSSIPSDKPIFMTELGVDLQVEMQRQDNGYFVEWSSSQCGLELISPEAVEILETSERKLTLQIKARGMGSSPTIEALLESYRGGVAVQNVSSSFQSAYQSAYEAIAGDANGEVVNFTVIGVTTKDGFNDLSFRFKGRQTPLFEESHHSFRFDSPIERGVRVYSADQREEVVRDGVVGRPQDSYYSIDPNADLASLSKAIEKSGCQIVGMMDVKDFFDNEPLKRSFLVRGPPGRVFPAFDRLYEEQGREIRSQSYTPSGIHGASLAGEIGRIQNDADLTDSAKNALNHQIAQSFQLLNGFESYVPRSFAPYIYPSDGTRQPNSWILRGNSLPDDEATNPSAWGVTNTLSDPSRSSSLGGIIHVDSTEENTAYYAQTAVNAPWDLNGTRVVSLRFQIKQHDAVNGSEGALQFAFGDGIKSWTCQIKPNQIRIDGIVYNIPFPAFPNGLEADRFYTLNALVADGGNQAVFSIEGTDIAIVIGQAGGLNGIAFGDPGANIAGKFQIDFLAFDNVELAYTYGIFGTDDYADSDEIDRISNILLYLRSKGQPFRTSLIARWVKLLDPMVYRWLTEKYTGSQSDEVVKELHIFTNADVWFGDIVDIDTDKSYSGSLWWKKLTKVTSVINIDKEETQFWSIDKERNDIQLAGILMAWVYQQHEYKVWLAREEDPIWGEVNAFVLERKHLVENIQKWAKRAETIISVGGEIAISVTNEGADWALTIRDLSQGEYMAAVGFIPFVPGSAGKAIKVFKKGEGDAAIEAIYQASSKLEDFPSGKSRWWDPNLKEWKLLDFDNIYANTTDAGAVLRARDLVQDAPLGNPVRGWTGKKLLSTFSNSSVTVFKTTEPMKVFRVYNGQKGAKSNFFSFEKPRSKSQVEVDLALGNQNGPFQDYDRWSEVEIPEGEYVYMGYSAKQSDKYIGGGTQVWIEDDLVEWLDQEGWWDVWEAASKPLPQH